MTVFLLGCSLGIGLFFLAVHEEIMLSGCWGSSHFAGIVVPSLTLLTSVYLLGSMGFE